MKRVITGLRILALGPVLDSGLTIRKLAAKSKVQTEEEAHGPDFRAPGGERYKEEVPVSNFFKKPSVHALFGIPRGIKKHSIKAELPIDVLEPTQETVYMGGVKGYAKVTPPELPLVILHKGRYFVQNHTRIAAQIHAGATRVKVMLTEYYPAHGGYYDKPDASKLP